MFTPAQLLAIKNDIAASGDMNVFPNSDDGNDAIAQLYKALAVPDTFVWRTDAKTKDIFDAINWALYTPADVIDVTSTVVATNRLLAIQTKQMNLQNMTMGKEQLDMSKANIRAGIRDAVIQVPAGVNGAAVAPGGASGATVLNACLRKCNRLEKLLLSVPAVTTGTVTAGVMGFEGVVTYQDIGTARNS